MTVAPGTYELWWPAGYVTRRRYCITVTASMSQVDGPLSAQQHSSLRRSIGFRTVRLVREPLKTPPLADAETFCFEINGVPTYMRGAPWSSERWLTDVCRIGVDSRVTPVLTAPLIFTTRGLGGPAVMCPCLQHVVVSSAQLMAIYCRREHHPAGRVPVEGDAGARTADDWRRRGGQYEYAACVGRRRVPN